jgi:hypothetical protein
LFRTETYWVFLAPDRERRKEGGAQATSIASRTQ